MKNIYEPRYAYEFRLMRAKLMKRLNNINYMPYRYAVAYGMGWRKICKLGRKLV